MGVSARVPETPLMEFQTSLHDKPFFEEGRHGRRRSGEAVPDIDSSIEAELSSGTLVNTNMRGHPTGLTQQEHQLTFS